MTKQVGSPGLGFSFKWTSSLPVASVSKIFSDEPPVNNVPRRAWMHRREAWREPLYAVDKELPRIGVIGDVVDIDSSAR